jgi:branched-chain amino acid transport system permease protein
MGSIQGALVGGLLIGILEGEIGATVSGSWQDTAAYLVLLAVLLVRPSGLFGRRAEVRV